MDVVGPQWEEVDLYSKCTKTYCVQWDSLKPANGLLYCNWEMPARHVVLQKLVVSKSLWLKVGRVGMGLIAFEMQPHPTPHYILLMVCFPIHLCT